jgi:hypothetical protein
VNRSLEAALTKTGANAPIDPEEKKKVDEELERKRRERVLRRRLRNWRR